MHSDGPSMIYSTIQFLYSRLSQFFSRLWVLIVLVGLGQITQAQGQTYEQASFGQQTSYLDPATFPRVLPRNGGYVAFAKLSGRGGGKATYVVQELSASLEILDQHELELPADAKPVGFHQLSEPEGVAVIVHQWDPKEKTTAVSLYTLGGSVEGEKELERFQVANWRDSPQKGQVAAHLEGLARSGDTDQPPLGYGLWVTYSPSRAYFLVYNYDFSKPGLLVNTRVYTADGTLYGAGQLPINRGKIAQALYVNDRGEVLLLQSGSGGGEGLVRFNLKTRESTFLEVPSSNMLRRSFQIHQVSEDEVYVANTATREGELQGVMFARFDFSAKEVSEVTYWQLSRAFKHQYDTTYSHAYGRAPDWYDLDLVDFRVDGQGRKWLQLEKRIYSSPGFPADPMATLQPELWRSRNASITVDEAMILVFGADSGFEDGTVLLKNGSANAEEGLRMVGMRWTIIEGSLHAVYQQESLVGTELKYSIWHPGSMGWTHEVLPTEGLFTLIQDYTSIVADGLLVGGYTSALGRSSALRYFAK